MKILLWVLLGLVALAAIPFLLVMFFWKVGNSPSSHGATAVNAELSNQYYYQKDKVVYVLNANFFNVGEREIEGADYDSFEVIDQNHARDKNWVYYREERVEGLDPSTAKAVPGYLPEDGSPITRGGSHYVMSYEAVYLSGEVLPVADPATFLVLWGVYSRDSQNLYYWNDVIIPIDGELKQISSSKQDYLRMGNKIYAEGVLISEDAENFEFMGEDDKYARDSQQVFEGGKRLENALASSFEIISPYFTKDADRVYYLNREIIGIDSASFKPLSDSFSKDEKNVYFGVQRIVNAGDPSDWGKGRANEREKIWQWARLSINESEILIVPADEVEELSRSLSAYDGKVYAWEGLIEGAKPEDVTIIDKSGDQWFSVIKDKAFYRSEVIVGADVSSFAHVADMFTRDAHNLYHRQHRVSGIHPDNFEYKEGLYADENEQGEYVLRTDDGWL